MDDQSKKYILDINSLSYNLVGATQSKETRLSLPFAAFK